MFKSHSFCYEFVSRSPVIVSRKRHRTLNTTWQDGYLPLQILTDIITLFSYHRFPFKRIESKKYKHTWGKKGRYPCYLSKVSLFLRSFISDSTWVYRSYRDVKTTYLFAFSIINIFYCFIALGILCCCYMCAVYCCCASNNKM